MAAMGFTGTRRRAGVAHRWGAVLCLATAACTPAPAEWYDPSLPHHQPNGFVNVPPTPEKKLSDLLRWRREAGKKLIPEAGDYTFPTIPVDRAALNHAPDTPTVTWIGHATVLIRVNGVNVLTDPQFSARAAPVQWAGPRRAVPPVPGLTDLPPIHAVVLSHDHYDSLDVGTVRALRARPGGADTVFFTPLGYKPWFARLGVTRVVERDWWQSAEHLGLTFTAVPVQHWCKRGFFDRDERLWSGWTISGEGFNGVFLGDSGYTVHFAEIGRRLGPFDVAMIPIGAYEPRWFMRDHHINPAEAVRAHADLRAKRSIAIHWGTFVLTDEPLTEPPVRLAVARQQAGLTEADFAVLVHGETVAITP